MTNDYSSHDARLLLYEVFVGLAPAFPFGAGAKGEVVKDGDEGAACVVQSGAHLAQQYECL